MEKRRFRSHFPRARVDRLSQPATLEAELAAAGLQIGRVQVLNGTIPITYIDGTFT
jgi:hypothetical protein